MKKWFPGLFGQQDETLAVVSYDGLTYQTMPHAINAQTPNHDLQARIKNHIAKQDQKIKTGTLAECYLNAARKKIDILQLCLEALNNLKTRDQLYQKAEIEKKFENNYTMSDGYTYSLSSAALLVNETLEFLKPVIASNLEAKHTITTSLLRK